jgi:hypothetical protein
VVECTQHPEAAAVATCVICQEPICDQCRTWHAGYATCHMCAAREQLRQARGAMGVPQARKAAAEATGPTLLSSGFCAVTKALLFAGLVAVAGACLWSRLALWSGGSLGVLAIALGWGAGTAVRAGAARRSGPLLTSLTLLLAAFGVMLGFGLIHMGEAFRLKPELAREAAGIPLPLQVLLFTAAAPSKLGLLEWLCAYLALFAAWRAARPRIAPLAGLPAAKDAPCPARAVAPVPASKGDPSGDHGSTTRPGAPPPMGPTDGEKRTV